ncbi:peptidylprolyl isomerase [Bacillus thuringiensis]|uniref:peptidylprolyl isomerase n=1 Tax=Bacillus thuringiensis TaxID=1428 RepID=UPI0005AF1E5D|nr:peptidylprolyl isomerase [Bacillus thuringiensis]KIP28919.1 PPIC-type PPIASE domain protein [Bacillus thuringiensis serovar morrisoni]MCT6948027.1 peptidylprolyl isomerase [Bacillus thuringiensis]MED2077223.1 peptidylprolyl isomerase [Bacillus thuringiensis]NUW50741.1 peptidylprolyl isomerase [Bacillus thuringiensis]HDR6822735.1 peptidylprolyl isomerase [Bacillus thuringiensis]
MKKRLIFVGATMSSILLLSACGNSDNLATSKSGDLTQEEFNKELKNTAGKAVLQQTMLSKILLDKYKVSDDEANKKVEELKKQMGVNFKPYLTKAGAENEADFVKKLKTKLAFEKAVKDSVTEKEIKDLYKPKLKASHILIKDEKTAKEVKEKINNGEDFAALAKQYSEDPGSKEKGGELPEFGPGKMDPKFEEATYKLEVGQVSNPVKSPSGYHIIKLTEKKELKPFDQEKETIRKELEAKRLQDQRWQQEFFKDLFKKANIKIKDNSLKDTFKEFEK